jgi:hypothetical protein
MADVAFGRTPLFTFTPPAPPSPPDAPLFLSSNPVQTTFSSNTPTSLQGVNMDLGIRLSALYLYAHRPTIAAVLDTSDALLRAMETAKIPPATSSSSATAADVSAKTGGSGSSSSSGSGKEEAAAAGRSSSNSSGGEKGEKEDKGDSGSSSSGGSSGGGVTLIPDGRTAAEQVTGVKLRIEVWFWREFYLFLFVFSSLRP